MKILFLGDIVGKKGREVIRDSLASLKEKYKPDFIIANGENSAHGKGITSRIYYELIGYGIDAITMGNHTYAKKEIFDDIDSLDKLIVPFNINDRVGSGFRLFEINNKKLCVVNILGQAFLGELMSDPYESFKSVLKQTEADIYFIDFHGEATAEKRLFLEYFYKDINVVVGTHTHIQTADECILHNRVAFISDVGMCGPYDSIIGRSIEESIKSHIFHEKTKYEVCESDPILCAVLIELDDNTYFAKNIERIQIRPY